MKAVAQRSPDPLDAVLRRLDALEARVRALEPLDDARFLAIAAATTEGHPFSVDELLDHAKLHPELAEVLRGATTKKIGKRLERLAGRCLGGFVVRRVKRDAYGVVWSVGVSAAHLHGADGAAGV